MKGNRQRWSWAVDALLFVGFLVAMWLDLTGLAVHQWWGVALVALAGHHLLAHGQWVAAVAGRFFGRTSGAARRAFLVDAALAAGFIAIAGTGIVISSWLDLALASYGAWRSAHVVASVATLALVVVKIALHWRWIISVGKRYVFGGASQPARQPALAPATVPVRVGRRDFIGMMAAVGAVSLLMGAKALASAPATGASAAAEDEATAVTVASETTGACTVACGRRCSYPGHCRRYVDSNNNGRCDLGECGSGTSASGATGDSGVPFQGEGGLTQPGRPRRGSRG